MKIVVLIVAGVLLLVLGLFWLSCLGTNTTEQVVAEISDGPDRLTLKAVYSSNWGNSYAARVLFFNDELVDFRGSLLRVDILDSTNAEMLKKWESAYKPTTYLECGVPYDLLKKHYPDLEHGSPWTIWVNPKDFSEKQYQRIVAMLRQHAKSLFNQQVQFDRNDANHPNNWLKYPDLLIWRTVYHDYASLKSLVFERKNGKTEETVTIAPYGTVEYRQKSERHEFGYGCVLG